MEGCVDRRERALRILRELRFELYTASRRQRGEHILPVRTNPDSIYRAIQRAGQKGTELTEEMLNVGLPCPQKSAAVVGH